jgi:hypothetical protein
MISSNNISFLVLIVKAHKFPYQTYLNFAKLLSTLQTILLDAERKNGIFIRRIEKVNRQQISSPD